MLIQLNSQHHLICPLCRRSTTTSVDAVHIGARPEGEDGPWKHLTVTGLGHIKENHQVDVAGTPSALSGRGHFITLLGWCELCEQQFGLEFKQHDDMTAVAALQLTWTEPLGS